MMNGLSTHDFDTTKAVILTPKKKVVRKPRKKVEMSVPEPKVFTIRDENRFRLDGEFVASYIGTQPAWGYGVLSYVTYKRTYARPVSIAQLASQYQRYLGLDEASAMQMAAGSKQVTEEYWQTLTRVVEGISSTIKQQVVDTNQPWSDEEEQHHAQEMFRRMWAFKFTPPGRGLWFMGSEAMELKGGAALNNCGFTSTENIHHSFSEPFCVLMDYSMLGVGMGFDLLGAGGVTLQEPAISLAPFIVPDTREGWIECVRMTLNAFVGQGTLPRVWDYSLIRKEGLPLRTFGGTASGYKPLEQLLTVMHKMLSASIGKPITGTLITDLMNLIGKCVVAGNVRRSSEIALGDPNDPEFIGMKDNSSLIELFSAQTQIAEKDAKWARLQRRVTRLSSQRYAKNLSVLSSEYAVIQDKIDRLRAKQKKVAAINPEWVQVQEGIENHPLMTHRWASNNTAMCPIGQDYVPLAKSTERNGEPGYAWPEIFRQYGRLIDPPNWKDRHAKGLNPCGEQTLFDMELCCLVETYPTQHETLEDFLMTLKYAYRYAKAVTLIPTHNKRTNAVMVRNRRIGTSMAGIIEMYCKLGLKECINWWDTGYKHIQQWDAEYSNWMGVNLSIKTTSIKPGGTTPLMVGCEGGMKAPTSAYNMRTIRIDHISPLLPALREAGYRIEKDRTTPRTMVVYFPVKNKEGVRTGEQISLWEQALIFTNLQKYWADNMVSATLTFQAHEAKDIANVLAAYEGQWKCVSFLPLSNHGFLQAPYIPCTEEEYLTYASSLKPLSLDGLVVGHDTDDKYCSGGICEVKPAASA